ncbi:MAG: FAD-dependent oxidoreductase [Oscillospiraceae bacterium]|nr:FAD-dependent oxidoreductase [Oscillospiraceae bacterium]MDD3261687.1 FAD-dependent oxidoreductase [Oscillospiraceae bacterium]
MRGQKRIAIIGGGIAGLSAGIYAQLHGFRTTIYEKNSKPGGACMGFLNAGVPVEPAIRFLAGTKEGTPLYRCWCETGALGSTLFVTPDSFFTLESSGTSVNFGQDIEAFEQDAAEISPEDAETIRRFCSEVQTVQAYELPAECPADLLPPFRTFRTGSAGEAGKLLARLQTVSLADFSEQLHHPALSCAFQQVMPAGSTLAQLVLYYAKFLSGELAVPVGGSAGIIQRMVDCYLANDGELQLNAPVKEIIAANRAARGVALVGGEHLLTHWVIAACDPAYTCRVLLQDRYGLEKKLQARYCAPEKYTTNSLVRLFFSVPVQTVPLARTFSFETGVIPAAGEGIDRLTMTQFADDPTFVHSGRTVLAVDIPMPGRQAFRYWESLAQKPRAYQTEIDGIAASVQQELEKYFPEMLGQAVFLSCRTPIDYARQSNVYQGSCTAFIPTAQAKPAAFTGRLPGLDHLLLAGQWLGPHAGMHTALVQGKFAVQRICHDEHLTW